MLATSSRIAKLNAATAIEIFRNRPERCENQTFLPSNATSQALARRFNICERTVRDIWNRRSWRLTTRPLWNLAEIAGDPSTSDSVNPDLLTGVVPAKARKPGRPKTKPPKAVFDACNPWDEMLPAARSLDVPVQLQQVHCHSKQRVTIEMPQPCNDPCFWHQSIHWPTNSTPDPSHHQSKRQKTWQDPLSWPVPDAANSNNFASASPATVCPSFPNGLPTTHGLKPYNTQDHNPRGHAHQVGGGDPPTLEPFPSVQPSKACVGSCDSEVQRSHSACSSFSHKLDRVESIDRTLAQFASLPLPDIVEFDLPEPRTCSSFSFAHAPLSNTVVNGDFILQSSTCSNELWSAQWEPTSFIPEDVVPKR